MRELHDQFGHLGDAFVNTLEASLRATSRLPAGQLPQLGRTPGLNIPGGAPHQYSVSSWRFNPERELMVPGSFKHRPNVRILAARAAIATSNRFGATDLKFKQIKTGNGLTAPLQTDAAMEATVLGTVDSTFSSSDIGLDPPVDIHIGVFLTDTVNGDNRIAGLIMDDASLAAHTRYNSGNILNATKTDPVRILSAGAHGLVDADKIRIQGVAGMTELNGNDYFVDQIDNNEFDLYTDVGLTTSEDGTGFTVFSSPAVGEWVFAHLVATPDFFVVTWRLTY